MSHDHRDTQQYQSAVLASVEQYFRLPVLTGGGKTLLGARCVPLVNRYLLQTERFVMLKVKHWDWITANLAKSDKIMSVLPWVSIGATALQTCSRN